jgi:transposase
MYGVELYSKVRIAVLRDGLSQREAARRFGIDRGTVSKMVGHSAPPGYRQAGARVRPKLDAHAGFIEEILTSDLTAPKKQRHTIQRIFERLRDERGFDGGYTTVRDYVRPRRLSLKEAFVPLVLFGMECWLWLTLGAAFRPSRRTEKSGPDEIELCPAVHQPLDELELGDVTLGLSVGPWQRQSRPNSRLIVAEATGE